MAKRQIHNPYGHRQVVDKKAVVIYTSGLKHVTCTFKCCQVVGKRVSCLKDLIPHSNPTLARCIPQLLRFTAQKNSPIVARNAPVLV